MAEEDMSKLFQPICYWCQVNLSLHETAQLLAASFGFSKCEYDYENIFEWFSAKDAEDFVWNISRKHNGDGQPSFDDSLIIKLEPTSQMTDEIGRKLSNILSCPIALGEGWHNPSDTWIKKRFIPNS